MRRSRHHHPRPERPSSLQTLRPNGPDHLKNLPPLNPLNPGRGAAHPAAPFRLAALATHPREGGGQVTWRRGTLPQTLPIPFCGGGKGDHDLQTCLPPLVGGRGTTKWWRGTAEGGIIKTAAQPPPQPSGPKAPSNLRTLGPRPIHPKNLPL